MRRPFPHRQTSLVLLCAFLVPPLVLGRAAHIAASESCAPVAATVSVRWDVARAATADGVVARLSYPSQVDLPTSAGSPSAVVRVEKLSRASGGLFDAVRSATSEAQGGGHRVNVGLVTSGIEPGPFVRVIFDCTPGASAPPTSAFSCSAEVSDRSGLVEAKCEVEIARR
jgi:hypothetical protein